MCIRDSIEGAYHLWKFDLQSGSSTKLTSGAGERGAECDAAGDWVWYLGQAPSGSSHIFKVPISGGAAVQVSDRVAISGPMISSDGQHMAFQSTGKNGRIVAVNIAVSYTHLDVYKRQGDGRVGGADGGVEEHLSAWGGENAGVSLRQFVHVAVLAVDVDVAEHVDRGHVDTPFVAIWMIGVNGGALELPLDVERGIELGDVVRALSLIHI